MSYISLLQEHANNLKSNIDAGNERTDVNASQKAQGLQEKYQEVLDHYNAGTGAVSTLSSAFHQGRKAYRGLATQQAQKAKNALTARTSTPAELTKPTPAPATPSASEPVPATATTEEATATQVDPATNTNYNRLGKFPNLVNRGARQAPFQGNTNFPVAKADEMESDVRNAPLTPQQARLVADPTAPRMTPADRLIDSEGGPEALSARHSLLSAKRNDNVPDTLEGDIGNQGGKSLSSTFVRTGASGASGAGEAEEGALDIGKVLPKATSAISGTASKVAGAIGSEGLEAGAMTALDAIPVVGELAGAGLGLYSLFHSLTDKPPSAQEELAKEPTASEGSSIDPTALLGRT